MIEGTSSFRDRLLANESWESFARDEYQEAVRCLVTRRLSFAQRIFFGIITIALACLAGLHIFVVFNVPSLPIIAKVALIEGAVLEAIAGGYLIFVLRKGVFHRRRTPTFLSGFMWVVGLLLAIHFVAFIPMLDDVNLGLFFLGVAMLTLAGTGLPLIRTCIEQSELRMHERLLELTYLRLSARRASDPDSP